MIVIYCLTFILLKEKTWWLWMLLLLLLIASNNILIIIPCQFHFWTHTWSSKNRILLKPDTWGTHILLYLWLFTWPTPGAQVYLSEILTHLNNNEKVCKKIYSKRFFSYFTKIVRSYKSICINSIYKYSKM